MLQDTTKFEVEGTPKVVRLVLDDDKPYLEVRDIAPTTSSSSTDNGEEESGTIKRTLLDDIIGCSTSTSISPSSSSSPSKTLLEIFAYPRIVEGLHCFHRLDPTRASRSAGHLRLVSSDAALAKRWETQIKSLCCQSWPRHEQEQQQQQQGEARRRRLLVIVNPVSGRRRSLSIYHSVVKPMFEQADVEHELIVTNRAHHAKDVAREMDLEWDGIVTIGGDGILSEVVNGLYERDDKTALQRMPLAIIKGGTGNGLFSSVMHANKESFDPLNAVFVILKAQRTISTDLSLVETKDGKKHLSFLSLSYALIADVDLGSETLRWAGAARMDLFAFVCILRKRRYHAKLSFLPCEKGEEEDGAREGAGTLLLPPLEASLPVDEGWVHLEDDFLMLLITHVSHIAETVHSSPGKRLGDGTFHIQLIRKPISRFRLISLFSALEHGGHVEGEEVEVYHARAYRLTPLNKEGTYSMDGEVIEHGEHGPVQALILPQAIQLLGSLE